MDSFGKELIIDIWEANHSKFTRGDIENYFIELCELIDMEREDLHWWDYDGYPEEYKKAPIHLKGISAVQFIKTSNITIHTIDVLKRIYINVFSCKPFSSFDVIEFTTKFFGGRCVNSKQVERL